MANRKKENDERQTHENWHWVDHVGNQFFEKKHFEHLFLVSAK